MMFPVSHPKSPPLSLEEEQELFKKIKSGNLKARQELILSNIGLVLKLSHHYKNLGLPLQDIINEGYLGLIHAIDRFDASYGKPLSTYAIWWIKHFIQKALARNIHSVYLPPSVSRKISQLQHIKSSEKFSTEQAAEEMGCSVTKIQTLQSVSGAHIFYQEDLLDEASQGNLLDENTPTPVEYLEKKSLKYELSFLMKKLSTREVKILQLRYGLNGIPPKTLEEIHHKIGLTRERIRQIEKEALKKLKNLWQEM